MHYLFKNHVYHIHPGNRKANRAIILAGILSVVAFISLRILSSKNSLPYSDEMLEASRIMEKGIFVIGRHCVSVGNLIDHSIDPNRTGLIGPEFSDLVSTLGHLQAKRTTTNPAFAGLIVHLLVEGGVTAGDTIAIGCSASFPALMLASLAAAQTMGVHPIMIISLGASSYGATHVDFHMLDMFRLLKENHILTHLPAAISLGGEKDIGSNYPQEIKEKLRQDIQESGISFLYEPVLQNNVSKRLEIYGVGNSKNRIKSFINTGGSYANMGISSLVLKVKPGLNRTLSLPAKEERGILLEMAAHNIPCIHLLYIKGLVMEYGLPWDPIPLPPPDDSTIYHSGVGQHAHLIWIFIVYFLFLVLIIVSYWRKGKII